MCPVWECNDSGLDDSLILYCNSYERALVAIQLIKKDFKHLRLQYDAKTEMRVWNFNSDKERTYFILRAELYF